MAVSWRPQMTKTDDENDKVRGKFNEPVPCPGCDANMSPGYDGFGLPAASCPECGRTVGDDYLRGGQYWEEI